MLKLKVITPDKIILDEMVDNISVPTTTGVITVLDRHIPLVSTIRLGEMVVRKEGNEIGYAVYKGLVDVRPPTKGLTEVVVLLERGESIDDLDHDRAEEALKRAKELDLEEGDVNDFPMFEGLIAKELNRVRIARKYKKHL
jgi:F-type H+-transporting ATPase subunit epsilon